MCAVKSLVCSNKIFSISSEYIPYSGKVWQEKLVKFTYFECLAKKFGELIDQPKVINCKY